MNWKENWYALLALGVLIILVLMSVFMDPLVGPDPALTEWTAWAVQYVALAIAAHKVWKLSDVLIAKFK